MIPKNIFGKSPHLRHQAPVSASLVQAAAMDVAALYERFASGPEGLSTEQTADYPGVAVLQAHRRIYGGQHQRCVSAP
jgi:hypothetical protein